jgi:hypothetical protein
MLGETITMLTLEDVEVIHGAINSLTFVKSGLTEDDSVERDLLDLSLIPLRALILQQKGEKGSQ